MYFYNNEYLILRIHSNLDFFDRKYALIISSLVSEMQMLTCALIAGDIVISCTLNILTVTPVESYSVSNRDTAHMINVNRMPIRDR